MKTIWFTESDGAQWFIMKKTYRQDGSFSIQSVGTFRSGRDAIRLVKLLNADETHD